MGIYSLALLHLYGFVSAKYNPSLYVFIFVALYEVSKIPALIYSSYDVLISSIYIQLINHAFLMCLLVFGFWLRPLESRSVAHASDAYPLHVFMCLFPLSIALGFFSLSGGLENPWIFFRARMLDSEALKLRSDSYIFILLSLFSLYTCVLLFKYRSSRYILIFLLASSLYYLFTGSRGAIFYSLLSVFFIKYDALRVGLLSWTGAAALVLLTLVFPFLGAFRSLGIEQFEDLGHEISRFTLANYQGQLRDEHVIAVESNGMFGEVFSLIEWPLIAIPSSLFPFGDKPKMLDGFIAEYFFSLYDVGFPVNLPTEFFLNFGFLFVLFVPAYLLILNSMFYLIAKVHPRYIVPFGFLLQTGTSSKLVYLLQCIILLVAFFLLFRLSKKAYEYLAYKSS